MHSWQGAPALSTLSTHLQQERVLFPQKRRRQGWESPDLSDCTASHARHPSPLVSKAGSATTPVPLLLVVVVREPDH